MRRTRDLIAWHSFRIADSEWNHVDLPLIILSPLRRLLLRFPANPESNDIIARGTWANSSNIRPFDCLLGFEIASCLKLARWDRGRAI